MNTNLQNLPVGGTIVVTNADGTITHTTLVGRTTETMTIDLRLWIPIILGVVILAVYLFRLFKQRERT
jgi:hypothetical protein